MIAVADHICCIPCLVRRQLQLKPGNREELERMNATSQPMTRSSPLLKYMAAMKTKAISSSVSHLYDLVQSFR